MPNPSTRSTNQASKEDSDGQTPEAILHARFGLESFRTGQREIIDSVLQGRDTLAILPTGGGKSLCYQLPAVLLDGLVIVISPLISLMADQVNGLKQWGIPTGAIHSGQSAEEKRQVFAELNAGGAYVLYLSPERVQKAGFARWLEKRPVALFAADEAHCLSQWGHDFRKDYFKLGHLRTLRPDVPMLALTATATPPVIEDISTRLGLRDPSRHVYGFYRPNLFYQVLPCDSDGGKLANLNKAIAETPTGRVLVYCGTRKQTETVAEELARNHQGVGHYHAGLGASQREQVQTEFEQGVLRILVATNAFGMGIDRPDVRLVVHYQMTGTLEAYYQEIGRAGRDGAESTCLLLYARKDKNLHHFFIKEAEVSEEVRAARRFALDAMVGYAEGADCRHGEILTYFRDAQRLDNCGHCDSCAPQSSRAIGPAVVFRGRGKGAGRAARNGKQPPGMGMLSPEAAARFDSLRAWRKGFAKANDIPAFMVFSDKTLRALCDTPPGSLEEMGQIYGLGEMKVERFGAELLVELRKIG